jgi:hypothetical protein
MHWHNNVAQNGYHEFVQHCLVQHWEDMVTIQAKVAPNMVEELGFSIQKQDSTIFHELLPSLDMSKGLHARASSILERFMKKCQLDV